MNGRITVFLLTLIIALCAIPSMAGRVACVKLVLGTFLVCPTNSLSQSHRQVSFDARHEVVQQMVGDRQVTNECVQEQGGINQIAKALEIFTIKLTRKGQAVYKIMGSGCAGGMYSGGNRGLWLYRRTSKGLELILGEEGGVDITPVGKFTNGYADLKNIYDLWRRRRWLWLLQV